MVFQGTISARNPRDMTRLKRKQRRGFSKKIGQNVLSQGKEKKQADAVTRKEGNSCPTMRIMWSVP